MSTVEPTRAPDRSTYVDEPFLAQETIQPHGIVAVVEAGTLIIESISENAQSLLGRRALDLCGAPLASLLESADAEHITSTLRESRLAVLNPHDLTLPRPRGKPVRVECTVHRREGGRSILEFEPCGPARPSSDVDEAQGAIERLTAAPDIPALLASAAHDVCAISGFDRTLIYRFDRDRQCEIMVEQTAAGVKPWSIGKHTPAQHVPESMRRLHLRSMVRSIPDTHYKPVRMVTAETNPPAAPIDLSRAILCGISPDYLDTLVGLGSRATLTVSIIIRGRLWGLIACHHAQPRRAGYRTRASCERIGQMLARQLDARLEKERLHERSRAVSLQGQIAAAIETAQDIGAAAVTAAPLIFDLLRADGMAVRIGEPIRRSGRVPLDSPRLVDTAARLNARAEHGVSAAPAGPLFIRLAPDGKDFLMLFDSSADGGRAWSKEDIHAALALRGRFDTALQALERQRNERVTYVDLYLEGRNARAAALIKLHEDVAAALPSRSAITRVILDFAQRETDAGGAVMETLTDSEIVYEAASGMLAPYVGSRTLRAGSLSAICVDLNVPLLCDDSLRDVEQAEREACARMGIASLVVVPIALSDVTTIVLKVASGTRGAFDDEDIQTLKLAATNLLTALRSAQKFAALAAAEREQRTYAQRLRALHAIASTTTSNRKDQIDAALHLGLEQLDLDWAFLGVIDYAASEFVIESSVGRDDSCIVEAGSRTPLGTTIMGRVARTKGVRIVQDVPRSDEGPAFGGWASYISVPLFIGGTNYGAIGFTSREIRPQPFSEANIEFVAVAGELIASAIERGLQQEQLEASETRYRALTEAMPEMFWVIDSANVLEYVNARWTDYTGLTLEESRRCGPQGIYDADLWPIVNSKRNATPAVEYDCEVRLRRHDGAYRWHQVRSVPFRSAAGETGRWLVTAIDIEERKSAEELMADVHKAALAATEAKSRFLATMSHEIRTPMNAVIGMTELLLLTQLNDEQREYIEIVHDSGQSLLRVLNDILDYSKIEAGKLELETVHFDLAGQIESVVELLRAQYQIKGVRLTTSIAKNVPSVVVGDPGRLRQILMNLAGNALKFTTAGGSVHMEVAASAARGDAVPLRFTVKDTGIGIPQDIVGRLFQPFSQGDESTTRKYGGTGLGLSICAQLVALMNGTIGVRSTPGQGSAFWFEIPLRAAKNSPKASERKRGAARSKPVVMRQEKILLVEDNEINTLLALKQLQRIGFVVSAVADGRQAVEAVAREHFDLVFMDCHMPEMDGFAATREIRRLEAGGTRRLPIVAMTADARTEDHQNCLLAGMDDYVSKPTSLESLRVVLDRWLPAPDRRQKSRNAALRSNPPPTLRVAKLLELFAGDRGAVIALLTAAASSINGDLSRIEAAAAAAQFTVVAQAAHRLRGTSGSIRSPRLGEISGAVERAALTATESIPDELLAELRTTIETLTVEVEKHRKLLATIG